LSADYTNFIDKYGFFASSCVIIKITLSVFPFGIYYSERLPLLLGAARIMTLFLLTFPFMRFPQEGRIHKEKERLVEKEKKTRYIKNKGVLLLPRSIEAVYGTL
jgi:hypothetical protein